MKFEEAADHTKVGTILSALGIYQFLLGKGETFAPMSRVSEEGRTALGARVNEELRKQTGVTKLTEANYFDDEVKVETWRDILRPQALDLEMYESRP